MNLTPFTMVTAFAGGYVILSTLQLVLYKWGYERGRRDGEVTAATEVIVSALRGTGK
jgi:hypothetical protein